MRISDWSSDVCSSDLPGVICCTGFKSDMTGSKALALQDFCRARNQQCTRFDYQGHGASSGDFAAGTIGLWLGDALAVLDAVTSGPQIVVGSSMGGWIALLMARARPRSEEHTSELQSLMRI